MSPMDGKNKGSEVLFGNEFPSMTSDPFSIFKLLPFAAVFLFLPTSVSAGCANCEANKWKSVNYLSAEFIDCSKSQDCYYMQSMDCGEVQAIASDRTLSKPEQSARSHAISIALPWRKPAPSSEEGCCCQWDPEPIAECHSGVCRIKNAPERVCVGKNCKFHKK